MPNTEKLKEAVAEQSEILHEILEDLKKLAELNKKLYSELL